jgi:hypothetical protein
MSGLQPTSLIELSAVITAVFGDRESSDIGRSIDSAEYGAMQHSLVYGEVAVSSMMTRLVRVCRALHRSTAAAAVAPWTFYDLGSGEGLPCVIAAASGLPFVKVTGIELVKVSAGIVAAVGVARTTGPTRSANRQSSCAHDDYDAHGGGHASHRAATRSCLDVQAAFAVVKLLCCALIARSGTQSRCTG